MKRTILAGAALLLAAACGASGGVTGPGGAVPAGQPVRAPVAVPAQPAQPAPAPTQGQQVAPALAPPVVPRATSQPPVVPAPSSQPGGVIDAGTSPAERTGAPRCPLGNPPLHRLCPV
jgi:hypothetical protein